MLLYDCAGQHYNLCELPVAVPALFFNLDFGRPSKELHTVIGVLILLQIHDMTDAETVQQLAFNLQWQYALNIFEESDSAKYMSLKTLWNMRSIVVTNGLETTIFERITGKLASVFNVDTAKQRIDSVHIQSDMSRLGRIGIFNLTIHKFLVNLKRGHKDMFATADESIIDKYLSDKSPSCFSMVKPSESKKTLADVASDLYNLVKEFADNAKVKAMHSYKLLERVLKEQCNLDATDKDNPVKIKKPKEIPSDSLQNPSDPDATYSGHKGQGYQVQVMETYTETSDKQEKARTLNLITYVETEKACQSDALALIPAIESVEERELGAKEVKADSLYGSDDNIEAAKAKGVEVVAPTMGAGKKKDITLADFEFSDDGHVVSCPKGNKPSMSVENDGRSVQGFCPVTCAGCPCVNDCPVKTGKKYYYLRYNQKEQRLARRRQYEQTDEFKDRYRWRAGSEATMSEFDRRTGVKHLRVRGFKAVRYCAALKAVGINLFRAAAVLRANDFCLQA
ncbi:MAG: hypothetical protein GY757_02290 [bacterium]|nr:hypothetical protein [bacterium]